MAVTDAFSNIRTINIRTSHTRRQEFNFRNVYVSGRAVLRRQGNFRDFAVACHRRKLGKPRTAFNIAATLITGILTSEPFTVHFNFSSGYLFKNIYMPAFLLFDFLRIPRFPTDRREHLRLSCFVQSRVNHLHSTHFNI